MDKSIVDKVNEELNSLDIINDSFLADQCNDEEEIGVIEDEITKKLVYYVLKVTDKKLFNISKKINDADSHDSLHKVSELAKTKEELSEVEARHTVAVQMLLSALRKYVKQGSRCPIYFIKKGWKVVKPKACDNCLMSGEVCNSLVGKVIPGSEKFRNNYKYN